MIDESLPPPFDAGLALRRTSGDRQFLRELVDVFLAEFPGLLTEIDAAIARGDAGELKRGAHTLKGAMNNFGATTACAAALRLETTAARGEIAQAPAMLAELRPLVHALATALAEFSAED